jgi:predicted acetyltransferase
VSSSTVTMHPAAEHERAVLENLAQLYCHDWSEMLPLDVGDDGRFADFGLASYWTDDWRHPFLLRSDGKLAGFALIAARSKITGDGGVFDMTEFFVLRRFRRQGVGLAAAFAAFDRFQGRWEVRQRQENPGATAFWRRAIAAYTDGHYVESERKRPEWTEIVQSFTAVGPRS